MYLILMQCLVLTPQCLAIQPELDEFWCAWIEDAEPEASGITNKTLLLWKPLKVLFLSNSNHNNEGLEDHLYNSSMTWLVFITVCNRLLEALPVFIEINVRARLLCCLCHRCKLWQKNNLVACIAPEFYPSRETAASGSTPCSLVALQSNAAYIWLLLSLVVVVKCPGAQQKLESVELCQRVATWTQRYWEKAPLKASVSDFTASYPVMWSGVNSAPALRAGKALGGHLGNFPASQREILLAEYLLGLYRACFWILPWRSFYKWPFCPQTVSYSNFLL